MSSRPMPRLHHLPLLGASVLVAACAGGTGSTSAATEPTARPDPTPVSTTVDGLAVTTIALGPNAAPIDVVAAFGSLWVANHRTNTVSRIDPDTLGEVATIQVGAGPGWFAVTDDAVWVSSQLGRGLTRIDPATNTGEVRAGDWATCGGPVVASGYIWQMACDAGIVMRIDPLANTSTDIYASGHVGVAAVDGMVLVLGPDDVSRLATDSDELERVGDGAAGFPIGFDTEAVWFAADDGVHRVAVEDGRVLATVALAGDMVMTIAGDHGWMSSFGQALYEIDLGSGEILRTLRLDRPGVAREIDGLLWVTSFDTDSLSRLSP